MPDERLDQSASPIEIRNAQGDLLRVNPIGGRIMELQLGNQLILTSITRGDKKLGQTHPCTPNSGEAKGEPYKTHLSKHGDMRDNFCTVIVTDDGEGIIIKYAIKDAPGIYPSGVTVEQRLSIKDGVFTCQTTHTNNGEQEAPVNFAEHLYWAAPDDGYKGTLINDKNVTELIEKDKVIPLRNRNIIQIPGRPRLILTAKGFRIANLWVAESDQGKSGGKYACIEPVENGLRRRFNNFKNMISPRGGSRTATFTISVDTAAA